MKPVALTIAGSDPSGGAGIQADLKTFHQFGIYGEAVITLLTVQNTRSVSRVELVSTEMIAAQISAVLEDIPPDVIKTGALGSSAIIRTVARTIKDLPLVVDPVMISKHGARLLDAEAAQALKTTLLPRATILMPNLLEAEVLTGLKVESPEQMEIAGKRLFEMGPKAVLVKGGHLPGEPRDVLVDEQGIEWFHSPRVDTVNTHGTGCTYSAAIAALLARNVPVRQAVARAKTFISEAIRSNPQLGEGSGPVNHHASARFP